MDGALGGKIGNMYWQEDEEKFSDSLLLCTSWGHN